MNNQEILKRIEQIEARTEKATPGPWEWDEGVLIAADEREIMEWEPEYMQWKDMEFIAHSRTDVPWLCELARKLLAVAEAAQEFHDAIYNEKNVYETWPDIMESREVYEAGNRLREALAALEEVEG